MPKDDQTYRAAFRVPEERSERLLPYMRDTLSDLFGIRAHWEGQERDVYVLRRIKGHAALPESRADQETIEMMRGKITLRREPASKLCDLLTDAFQAAVIDETGMNGVYDFDIPYQPGQLGETIDGINRIGLEAVKERRSIQVLVVTPERALPENKR